VPKRKRGGARAVPTADKTEHDFIISQEAREHVSLKEFLLGVMNERERKWDQRIGALDRQLEHANQAVKDALNTADEQIAKALISMDKRFELTIQASEKAVLKAEASNERRFEAVNEFRGQLFDQQQTLVRKAEVDIRFDAINAKLDAAISQLQQSKGKELGQGMVWGIVAVVLTLALSGVGVAVALITRH
jgi:tetrahydromethanopterin S-methyltransferase subunit G